MRHLFIIIILTGLAFVLAIGQYFITGIYGNIMYFPILGFLLLGYILEVSINKAKVLKK